MKRTLYVFIHSTLLSMSFTGLIGCKLVDDTIQGKITPSSTTIQPTTATQSMASFYTATTQPMSFNILKDSSISSKLDSQTATLALYYDQQCTQPVTGVTSNNSATIMSGGLNFSSFSYTLPSGLEEDVYLKVSAPAANLSVTTRKVSVLHRFNAGNGFSVLLNNQTGPAGAVAGVRDDFVYYNDTFKIDSLGRYVGTHYSKDAGGVYRNVVVRYLPNGSLDTSFGSPNGYVVLTLPVSTYCDSYSLFLDQNQKILIAGRTWNPASRLEMTVWRLNPDGSYDTTFGSGNGYVAFQQGGDGAAGALAAGKSDLASWVSQNALGSYTVVGNSKNLAGGWEAVCWLYNNDGTLDTTLNGTGFSIVNQGLPSAFGSPNNIRHDLPWSAAIDKNKKIIAVGYVGAGAKYAAGAWRFNSDCSVDTSFGNQGAWASTDYTTGTSLAGAPNAAMRDLNYGGIEFDDSGNYLLFGQSTNLAGGYEAAIWKVTQLGVLDPSFGSGTGAKLLNSTGTGFAGGTGVSQIDGLQLARRDSLGRYIVPGGSKDSAGNFLGMIMRFNSDLTLDTTFGSGTGYILYPGSGSGYAGAASGSIIENFSSMIIDPIGRFVIWGFSNNTSVKREPVFWRVLPDGTLDK